MDLAAIQSVMLDIINGDARPSDKARAAVAWEKLEERKRILRNRPLPKAVDVSKPKRKAAAPALHPDYAPD